MRSRPKILSILSFVYVLIAVSLPVQVMVLYEYPLSEITEAMNLLTWANWLVIFGTMICAVAIYRASGLARIAIPVLVAVVAFNNFVVGRVATDYSQATATFATLFFVALNLPLLLAPVRRLFGHPELHWWRTSPRLAVNLPLFIGDDTHLKAETFDISETGMFIVDTEKQELTLAGPLKINEIVLVHLYLGDAVSVSCKGRVVRQATAQGKYPAGYGLQFVDLPRAQRRQLRSYLQTQNH